MASPASGGNDEPADTTLTEAKRDHREKHTSHKRDKKQGHTASHGSPLLHGSSGVASPSSDHLAVGHSRRVRHGASGIKTASSAQTPLSFESSLSPVGTPSHNNITSKGVATTSPTNQDADKRATGAATTEDQGPPICKAETSPSDAAARPLGSTFARPVDTPADDDSHRSEVTRKDRGKKKHIKRKEHDTPPGEVPLFGAQSPQEQQAIPSPSLPLVGERPPPKERRRSVVITGVDTHGTKQLASTSKPASPEEIVTRDAKDDVVPNLSGFLNRRDPATTEAPTFTTRMADAEAELKKNDLLCGVFGFYPGFLQRCRSPLCALTVLGLASFTRSFSLTGLFMAVLPTLERRYHLKGYESGMVVSSNDVASCLAMLPVSFMATHRHKPRIVGYGVAAVGLGHLIVVMVHLMSPPYQLSDANADTCPMTDVESLCDSSGSIRSFRFMLMAGQLLSGLGSAPINTVAVAYIDENLPKRKSVLHIAIFNGVTILGPCIGFIVGGFTLSYYVDITTDVSSLGMSPNSPAWVGAWWLGILGVAASSFALGLIICTFPKHMPSYEAACAERKADQSALSMISMVPTGDFGRHLRDLPRATHRLLTNVPFMLLCLASSFSLMFNTGMTSILAKFFESQLGLPSSRIAYLLGLSRLGGSFGAVIGGALVSRWNLDYAGIMRLCLYNSCISWVGVFAFLFSCPQSTFATPDGYVGAPSSTDFSLICSSNCNCTRGVVNPICGADGVVYLSPCVAGCHKEIHVNNLKMYSDCSCVNSTLTEFPGVSSDVVLLGGVQATRSRCLVACGLLLPYLIGVPLALSSVFLNLAPTTAASIRCVKPAERSLALGIRQVIGRLVGSIPAPVIFGGILDRTCLTWHRNCGASGNCIVYENKGMAHGTFYAMATTLSVSMLLFYASLVTHRRQAHKREAAKVVRAVHRKSVAGRPHRPPE